MADDRCELLCLDLPRAEELRAAGVARERVEAAARQVKALADPTRLAVAAALADGGELCVCDLSWILERPQNLVSHHLRLLRSEGLAGSRRDGKMVIYALTPRGRAMLDAALSDPVAA